MHRPGTGNAAQRQIGCRIGCLGRRGGQIGGFSGIITGPAGLIGTGHGQKNLCTLHPYLSTAILSGLGVQGVNSLAFLRDFLCTLKPDKI